MSDLKQRPGTECLTQEMVRELVSSWVDDGGEWEEVGGRYRRVAGCPNHPTSG